MICSAGIAQSRKKRLNLENSVNTTRGRTLESREQMWREQEGSWGRCIGMQLSPFKVLASRVNPLVSLSSSSSSFDWVSGSPGFQTHHIPEGVFKFPIFLPLPSRRMCYRARLPWHWESTPGLCIY